MDRIENPVTGERIEFREGVGDPLAPKLALDFYVRPGGGVFVPHMHLAQTEILTVRSGRLRAGLPGSEREYGPGETVTLPPRTGHTLKNVGEGELHVWVEFHPAGQAESFLRNYFGICRDGRCDANGDPSLLQVALLMPAHDSWRADIPLLAQRLLFSVLAPIAYLLGYRARYPAYERRSA